MMCQFIELYGVQCIVDALMIMVGMRNSTYWHIQIQSLNIDMFKILIMLYNWPLIYNDFGTYSLDHLNGFKNYTNLVKWYGSL